MTGVEATEVCLLAPLQSGHLVAAVGQQIPILSLHYQTEASDYIVPTTPLLFAFTHNTFGSVRHGQNGSYQGALSPCGHRLS